MAGGRENIMAPCLFTDPSLFPIYFASLCSHILFPLSPSPSSSFLPFVFHIFVLSSSLSLSHAFPCVPSFSNNSFSPLVIPLHCLLYSAFCLCYLLLYSFFSVPFLLFSQFKSLILPSLISSFRFLPSLSPLLSYHPLVYSFILSQVLIM